MHITSKCSPYAPTILPMDLTFTNYTFQINVIRKISFFYHQFHSPQSYYLITIVKISFYANPSFSLKGDTPLELNTSTHAEPHLTATKIVL